MPDAMVMNPAMEQKPTRPLDHYGPVWESIRRLVPEATLLRGPACLGPAQAAGTGDLDILVPRDFQSVSWFLKKQGFYRVYKPQTYLERYRFQTVESRRPLTIDLYKAERWGLGFRLANGTDIPTDADMAALLHSVADGKGTHYFERERGGPPWQKGMGAKPSFGLFERALWRRERLALLTLGLLLKGIIRPDVPLILGNCLRRIAFRTLQLTRKTGLEVALIGVDGTGKTCLAEALSRLPAPVRVIYMGPHQHRTRLMRFALRHKVPSLFRQLAFRFDLLVRRIHGAALARRGWVVVYERHPAERIDPLKHSYKYKVKNWIDKLYAWPVDLTFYLTGDYPTLYLRKKEYTATYLQEIDRRYSAVLDYCGISYERIDVTRTNIETVASTVGRRVLEKYQDRVSVDRWPSIFKSILA